MSEAKTLCENCGKEIGELGRRIDETAGICAGPCEREPGGECAGGWGNGECDQCRALPDIEWDEERYEAALKKAVEMGFVKVAAYPGELEQGFLDFDLNTEREANNE